MYQILLYPQFQICFIIYCVWADKTVDIMGHLYIISRIGLPSSLYSCYISTVIGDSPHSVSSDFFHVRIINIGACKVGVSLHNLVSIRTEISC